MCNTCSSGNTRARAPPSMPARTGSPADIACPPRQQHPAPQRRDAVEQAHRLPMQREIAGSAARAAKSAGVMLRNPPRPPRSLGTGVMTRRIRTRSGAFGDKRNPFTTCPLPTPEGPTTAMKRPPRHGDPSDVKAETSISAVGHTRLRASRSWKVPDDGRPARLGLFRSGVRDGLAVGRRRGWAVVSSSKQRRMSMGEAAGDVHALLLRCPRSVVGDQAPTAVRECASRVSRSPRARPALGPSGRPQGQLRARPPPPASATRGTTRRNWAGHSPASRGAASVIFAQLRRA